MDVAFGVNACYANTADRSSDITIQEGQAEQEPCELGVDLGAPDPCQKVNRQCYMTSSLSYVFVCPL